WMAKANMVPTKAPRRANSTFWVVYENAIPTMLMVRREPAAKASLVAKIDRKRLGTTIPAMNRVNTTSISSRTNEEALCLFILFPFTLGRLFQEAILLACARSDTFISENQGLAKPLSGHTCAQFQ